MLAEDFYTVSRTDSPRWKHLRSVILAWSRVANGEHLPFCKDMYSQHVFKKL